MSVHVHCKVVMHSALQIFFQFQFFFQKLFKIIIDMLSFIKLYNVCFLVVSFSSCIVVSLPLCLILNICVINLKLIPLKVKLMQSELKLVKEFRRKRAQMQRELDEVRYSSMYSTLYN